MTYEEPGAIVAARLGYGHASFISMMERGTSRVPLERVFDVARALDLDPTWFLERMPRDRAETLPLADHLFGPGGPLHGASPAIARPPGRTERGREAARPEGAGGRRRRTWARTGRRRDAGGDATTRGGWDRRVARLSGGRLRVGGARRPARPGR